MSVLVPEPDLTTPVLYRVQEVAALLRLSRSVIYEQIRAGRLRTVRQGASRRIPAAAINDYIALLERESGEQK